VENVYVRLGTPKYGWNRLRTPATGPNTFQPVLEAETGRARTWTQIRVRIVTYALQKLTLFTENEGSMPLYEHRLRIEQESKKPDGFTVPRSQADKTRQDTPQHDTEENQNTVEPVESDTENTVEPVEEKYPPTFKGDLDRLKVQFGGLNTRMEGVETTLGDITAKINLLVANGGAEKGAQDPSNPPQQTVKPVSDALATPENPYARAPLETNILEHSNRFARAMYKYANTRAPYPLVQHSRKPPRLSPIPR